MTEAIAKHLNHWKGIVAALLFLGGVIVAAVTWFISLQASQEAVATIRADLYGDPTDPDKNGLVGLMAHHTMLLDAQQHAVQAALDELEAVHGDIAQLRATQDGFVERELLEVNRRLTAINTELERLGIELVDRYGTRRPGTR
jgi:hypothetical protein